MMKSSYLPLIFLLFLACACGGDQKNSETVLKKDADSTKERATRTAKRMEREIPVEKDFFQITNISSATVEYKPGETGVWVEGDSASLAHVKFEFDGGILTISTPIDANNDVVNYPTRMATTVHVSCPELKAMAICAGGGFVCHHLIRTDEFLLGGLVGGTIDIDSVACTKFRYESNGNTVLNIGRIDCVEASVISTGGSTMNLGILASGSTYLDIKNTSTLNADVTSPKVEAFVETSGSSNLTLDTDFLSLNAVSGTVNLSGKAKRQQVNKGKFAVVNNGLK